MGESVPLGQLEEKKRGFWSRLFHRD